MSHDQKPISELLEGKRLISLGNHDNFPERKVALLGSFTLDYLPPLLVKSFQALKIFPQIYTADFNQWSQEILTENSGLYSSQPDLVILITDLRDLFPSLYDLSHPNLKEQLKIVENQLDQFQNLMTKLFEKLPSTELYLVIPAINALPCHYIANSFESFRGQEILEKFLHQLRALGREFKQVVSVDWDYLTRKSGTNPYQDERLWYTGRMRLNIQGFKTLSDLIVYYYQTQNLASCKLVIVDLDNTLWGGVVGEEGLENIVLGHDGISLAFRDFQKELLKLKHLGVLLAICSKNDEKTAWEVFEKHPDMVLKREDFVAHRINWKDKAENIEELAKELSLGFEAMMFLDDDPIQRASIKSRLPLIVPDLPEDPVFRPNFIRNLIELHRFSLTKEDKIRSRLYQERTQRETLKTKSKNLEEFLSSLKQEATIAPMNPKTLPRSAQLCQKTNQFNLTTHRYNIHDLESMLNNHQIAAYTLSLKDIYGDNGIVGLGILRFNQANCEIDTFLMSCRVLGRKIEQGFLAFLTEQAKKRGVKTLIGRYLRTEKNSQTEDFFPKSGFTPSTETGKFLFDLETKCINFPPELTIILF